MRISTFINSITKNQNFRHGVLYTIFSFINSGFSFILVLILAKFLPPYEYGQLNLFTTFVTLVNIIIPLCTVSYITVSFFQRAKIIVRQIITTALGTTTLMLVLLSVLLVLFPHFFERCLGFPLADIWFGLLICYFQVFYTLNLDIWRLEEQPVRYGIFSLSFAICNFILTFALIVYYKLGWEGRIYAWFLLGLLYFVISIVFLIKRNYLHLSIPPFSLIKETLAYAIPLVPHSLSFWLKQGMDRYIINHFHDPSAVGYFSFAMNIAAIISIIGTAFNATNSVYLYKQLSLGYNNVKNTLRRQILLMTLVFFTVSVLVALLAWGIITFIVPQYTTSLQYILPLTLGAFFQCIYLLWVNYLFYYKKTTQLMMITFSTALLQCVLSIWLTRYSPLNTAIISMCISGLTVALVVYTSHRTLKLVPVENDAN